MKIYITDYFFDTDILLKDGHITSTKEKQTFNLKETDIIITRSKTNICSDFLDKFPRVKLVITTTSGFDHIDLPECKKRNIVCAYTPDANALPAAELTLTLALIALKDIKKAFSNMEQNRWRENLNSEELSNKTWGIIGFGRVGKRLYKLLDAFQLKILIHDPYVEAPTKNITLEEIFLNSDIVSLHVPNTRKTRDMVTENLVSKMKKNSVLINMSRASVISREIVEQALQNGIRVCLDVFETEPPPLPHKFKDAILTPHIGGFTKEAQKRASEDAIKIIRQFVSSKKIDNTLPPKQAWYQDGL